jgi:OmpR family response regulator RpaB
MEVYNEKILVVDTEDTTRQILYKRLTRVGYNVILASDGKEALDIFEMEQPNLVVLDIMLPKLDGYEICRRIRKTSQTPIIILAASTNISECVMGLDLGADDYIKKPFYPKELEARIRSLLRRSNISSPLIPKKQLNSFSIGSLVVEGNKEIVFKNGFEIKLTYLEFSLLKLLIENAGKALSRKVILTNVWGYTPEREVDTRVVDVHISRLRSKIEKNPSNPDLILTVRGIGYMFQNY